MKLFSLSLCISVLCVFDTAKSSDFGHPLLTTSLTGSSSHDIHRRQQSLADLINQLRTCRTIITDEQCNNGFVQENVNLLEQCNMEQQAELQVNRCQLNSNGDYCNLATTYINEVRSAVAECVTSVQCTARCRSLLMSLRDEVGCCLNLEYNSTISPTYMYSPVFTSELWLSCNLEPITEQCARSTVQLPQTQGSSCTSSFLSQQNGCRVRCNSSFLGPLLARLSSADCEVYSREALEQCAVDESNQPCYIRSPELTAAFGTVVNICQRTLVNRCDSRCTSALRNFASVGGCCINNLFNGSLAGITSFRYSWFSSQYWSLCGLNSPGFCNNGASTMSACNISPSTLSASTSSASTSSASTSSASTLSASTLSASISASVIIICIFLSAYFCFLSM